MVDRTKRMNLEEDNDSPQNMSALHEQDDPEVDAEEVLPEDPEEYEYLTQEDLLRHEPDAPEYTDMTKYPKMPEDDDENHERFTTGTTGPMAEEYWNPEVTGLEDNEPSSTLRNQMTSEEVYDWLQEPSDQVVVDRYD